MPRTGVAEHEFSLTYQRALALESYLGKAWKHFLRLPLGGIDLGESRIRCRDRVSRTPCDSAPSGRSRQAAAGACASAASLVSDPSVSLRCPRQWPVVVELARVRSLKASASSVFQLPLLQSGQSPFDEVSLCVI